MSPAAEPPGPARPETKGPWSPQRIARHLDETVVPLRLACLGASGTPVVASLWFLHRDGALWCATTRQAHIACMLERDPRCGFEVAADAPPYRGVRGQGVASLDPARGEEILRALIERYLGSPDAPLARWLLGRADQELAIRIEPQRLSTWDYTERMLAR